MTQSIISWQKQARSADRSNHRSSNRQFTGVVKEALEFAFDAARQGTLAESAELCIEIVPMRLTCKRCDRTFSSEGRFDFFCPACGQPADIVSGRELQIEYIDLA
jgi:hydrogenase nickel incorporation protein HypA/HybF